MVQDAVQAPDKGTPYGQLTSQSLDNGFQVVWPSPDSIYATGFLDLYAILQAMKAKASAKFLSPRQFMMERKKEGAKEWLGDILY